MPYGPRMRGDYATGGYGYRGDPGLLSFLGKAVKTVWKVAKPIVGAVVGGPLGYAIAGGAAVAGSKALVPVGPPAPPTGFFPGGAAAVGTAVGAAIPAAIGAYAGQAGVCPAGYHPAKDGSGRCVRNRRMNVANPRALRRGMRRVQGFEKLARKTISFTKRVRMKKRRRG